MNQQWYATDGATVYGPYSPDELRSYARGGQLAPQMHVRLGEGGEWFQAATVPGLFDAPVAAVPVVAQAHAAAPKRQAVILTERTAKRYKAMQALGVLAAIIGIVGIMSMSGNRETLGQSQGYRAASALCLIGGVASYVFGRILAWWNHA